MTTPQSSRTDFPAVILGLGALAPVLGALGFQYLDGLKPCEMCHWQRWPYIAAALIGLLLTPLWKGDRRVAAMAVIAAVAGAGLTVAHQWDLWPFALLLVAGLCAAAYGLNGRPASVVILLVAVSGLIGLYQTGMQYHILPGPSACSVNHAYILGSNDIPEVRCDAPVYVLGLVLPAWNAVCAFVLAGIGIALLRKNHAA